MRLGGPVFVQDITPDRWIAALKQAGYGATYCPVSVGVDTPTLKAYVKAAEKASIVIAEVGAWSNPLSSDEATRKAAVDKCKANLALAVKLARDAASTSPAHAVSRGMGRTLIT